MRGMNSASVDLIYLDPPFNSKKNYAAPIGSQAGGAAFQDTWSLDDVKREWVEEIEADNTATWSTITAAGFTQGESTQAYLTYMAIRLLEMRRLLKPTGSIYLHCDPTMSHYLKLMMDAILGPKNFRNEISWQRYGSHNDAKRYGRVSDRILFYVRSGNAVWNPQYVPLTQDAVAKQYRYTDFRGRYTTSPLQARTLTGGGYKYTWKGVEDTWKFPKDRLDQLEADKRIHWPETGRIPRRKIYLADNPGKPLPDIVIDVGMPLGAERTGYPTQKPLKLLERFILASSNPGDMVLDPFCGCATTCVASEKLSRQWAGIDIEVKARDLVIERLQEQADKGALFKGGTLPKIHHLRRPPKRTESGAPQRSKDIKRILYRSQEGRCAGNCGPDKQGRKLDLDLFEVDHIVPRSRGGADVDDNLQLLCPTCNRRKGSRTMGHLLNLAAQTQLDLR